MCLDFDKQLFISTNIFFLLFSFFAVRRLNDQMMSFDRSFIISEGKLGKTDLK